MAKMLKKTCLYICLAILLLSCLNESADCFSTCNGTAERCRIGESEFAIDETSEIMRRILASRTISYDALKKNMGYCNRDVYGSCIGSESKNYKDRPCNYQNLCKRDT